MCDFDIASFRDRPTGHKKKKSKKNAKGDSSGNSYAAYLEKLKVLGLDQTESDSSGSESDDSRKRRKPKKTTFQPILNSRWTDSEDDDNTNQNATNEDHAQSQSQSQIPSQACSTASSTTAILLSDDNLEEPVDDATKGRTELRGMEKIRLLEIQRAISPSSNIKKPVIPELPPLEQEDLDPELAKIAAGETPLSVENSFERGSSVEPRKVEIRVQFISLNNEEKEEKVKGLLQALTKPVKVLIMDNDPFDKLLTHYCSRKMLCKDQVVLVYKGVPVVLRATPASLAMSDTNINVMHVYLKSEFEQKANEEMEKKLDMFKKLNSSMFDEDFFKGIEPCEDGTTDDDKIFIKLRGKDKEDVTMRVKKTTTIGMIVKNYIHIKKLSPETADKIQLFFDEEALQPDQMVQDTELEDHDMLSVIIKS